MVDSTMLLGSTEQNSEKQLEDRQSPVERISLYIQSRLKFE